MYLYIRMVIINYLSPKHMEILENHYRIGPAALEEDVEDQKEEAIILHTKGV